MKYRSFIPLTKNSSSNEFTDSFNEHVKRYPELQATDIYKFAYQSTFGVGHIVRDEKQVDADLRTEICNLSNIDFKELMVEIIDPTNDLARVNLRPCMASNMDINKLITAMIETANHIKGSKQIMDARIKQVLNALTGTTIYDETKILFDEMIKKKYPAIHHSQIYKEKYKPAYRVIALKYLDNLLK